MESQQQFVKALQYTHTNTHHENTKKTQRRECKKKKRKERKKTKQSGNRDSRLSNTVKGWRRMGDRTV
jgi:hypothetical protein